VEKIELKVTSESATVISYGFDSLLTYLCIHSRVWMTDSDQLLVSSVLRASRYIFWSPRTQASQATGGAVAWWLNSITDHCYTSWSVLCDSRSIVFNSTIFSVQFFSIFKRFSGRPLAHNVCLVAVFSSFTAVMLLVCLE